MGTQLRALVCAALVVAASRPVRAAGASASSTPSVPHSNRAANLAAEVYSSLASSYFNFLSADIAGFDAVFTVQKDGKPLGNMTASWTRGDEKVSATLEGNADEKDKSAAESLVGGQSLLMGPN